MSDEYAAFRKRIQDLKGELDQVASDRQAYTRQCAQVLDSMIRPALRVSAHELPSTLIQYGEDSGQPFIRVRNESKDELRFRCTSNALEVSTQLGGHSAIHEHPLAEVSDDLITGQIESFLREALKLRARKD
jgi:hypothetical protein